LRFGGGLVLRSAPLGASFVACHLRHTALEWFNCQRCTDRPDPLVYEEVKL
jgi:hypothetical protein